MLDNRHRASASADAVETVHRFMFPLDWSLAIAPSRFTELRELTVKWLCLRQAGRARARYVADSRRLAAIYLDELKEILRSIPGSEISDPAQQPSVVCPYPT